VFNIGIASLKYSGRLLAYWGGSV